MRYEQFWPGDRAITIVEYNGVPSGTVGKVASRWLGTAYVVRLSDGTFRWLSDESFAPIDPSRNTLKKGDIGVVTSDLRQDFAQVGDIFEVVKVAHDVDYYAVTIGNEVRWFGGFQLAGYD